SSSFVICSFSFIFFLLMIRPPPTSTLFPYNDALPIYQNRVKVRGFRQTKMTTVPLTRSSLSSRSCLSRSFFRCVVQHFHLRKPSTLLCLQHTPRTTLIYTQNFEEPLKS